MDKSSCISYSGSAHNVLLFSGDHESGPVPAILDWYGHCVRLSVNCGGMPQEVLRIRQPEITSETMFGPKKLY